ncbi:winged helix-turn-helix domain-containing protein [Streptomyces sp. NPDC026589]|uniref:ArsR/SmtB family transcription factor n=1 Tax=Streptomyces sp. NPDC026589 TaxID=3155609 RepID=UPI003407F5A6
MMRIHFSVDDIARTRLVAAPSRLAVTTLSMLSLAHPKPAPVGSWRWAVRSELRHADSARHLVTAVCALDGPVPAFLLSGRQGRDLEDELEQLLSTPLRTLRANMRHVADWGGLPGPLRHITEGRGKALQALAGSIRDYHRVAIGPHWSAVHASLSANLAKQARVLSEGGVEQLLSGLNPQMRWRSPVLEVDSPFDIDYRLNGRGLLLAPSPSAFPSYVPCDPLDEQPTLHYQVGEDCTFRAHSAAQTGSYPALGTLLGHSRAAVLEICAEGGTTGQLAKRSGLSLSSVSEHLTALRHTGLITTLSIGRTRHHALTDLGTQLLRARF